MFDVPKKLTVTVIVWAVTLTTSNAATTVNPNEKMLGSKLGSVPEPTTEVSDGITWSGPDGTLGAHLGTASVLSFFLAINVLMFARTAWRIRCHNTKNAEILDVNTECRNAAERWFTLNMKLFLIMGGHIPIWLVWVIWICPTATHVLATFEAFQSSPIFYVFIWKDDVKRSFREQFNSWLSYSE